MLEARHIGEQGRCRCSGDGGLQGNRGFGLGAVGPETRDDVAAIERSFGQRQACNAIRDDETGGDRSGKDLAVAELFGIDLDGRID